VKHILFVDDDAMVLETIGCVFRGADKDWDLSFATSGTEALRVMETKPADVVVTDMRMPRMNGAVLLHQIMERYPKTVRIILSGYADMESAMHSVSGTHQYLSKPGDIMNLQATVRRAVDMDSWLNNDRVKTLVSQLTTVPSVPGLYFEILKELRSEAVSLDTVGATIAKDPAMTAKILQLVNSAFFGLASTVSNPVDAVMQLGLQTIKSLVLGIHVFTELDSAKDKRFHAEAIQHHCLTTAVVARKLAQIEHQKLEFVDACFTAGLLHDLGRLVLIANVPDQYAEAIEKSEKEKISLHEAERAVFGATHAEAGGYLLGLWGLPCGIVEATVFHHRPHTQPGRTFTPLTAVHVANVLAQDNGQGHPAFPVAELDQQYLEEAGLTERIPQWIEALRDGMAE
jgi:HD-like signal output (HDOD) protein/CheY-like chemotaxis protein